MLDPIPDLSYGDNVSLDAILCTEDLFERRSRPIDHSLENQALRSLMSTLAVAPQAIPQTLSNTMVSLLDVGSAGIHLQSGARWDQALCSAVAGAWTSGLAGVHEFAPAMDAVTRDAPLLLRQPERHYPSLRHLCPPAEECLVVPVHVEGVPVGALWVLTHDDLRRFDVEDLRQLQGLATFASAACQTIGRLTASERRESGLRESQAHLEEEDRVLRETGRQKDIFIATLAHELRQPVGALVSAVAVLRQHGGECGENQARVVIERQVNHLRHLLDDLHDLASIREGKIGLEREPLDVREVITEAVTAISPLVQARRHTLEISVPDDPIPLLADRTRLQQVLTNLLTNAAKYTASGGHIALRAARDGGGAVIEVSDNGRGIAPAALPHIFEVFVQEADRQKTGLGIGLHVVRRLVELHRGSVVARSDGPGRGSTFTVTLPVSRP
jgi:signal transduction histidine kinase